MFAGGELRGLLVSNTGRRNFATQWHRQTWERAMIGSLEVAPQVVQVLSAVAELRCGYSVGSCPD